MWREVLTTADDSILVNLDLFWYTKGDNFLAHSHTQARKVVTDSFGPLEINVLERSEFTSFTHVQLHVHEFATHCCVDAVLGNNDATLEI
jgi:hypothetical protein